MRKKEDETVTMELYKKILEPVRAYLRRLAQYRGQVRPVSDNEARQHRIKSLVDITSS